jgi:hypothetical protein
MKRKTLFIILGIILVLGASLTAFFLLGGYQKLTQSAQKDEPSPTIATYEGSVVCLPHKNPDEPHTLECAVGLKAANGNYYGLSGTTSSGLSTATGDQKTVKITGELQEIASDKYQMAGIISVKDFSYIEE